MTFIPDCQRSSILNVSNVAGVQSQCHTPSCGPRVLAEPHLVLDNVVHGIRAIAVAGRSYICHVDHINVRSIDGDHEEVEYTDDEDDEYADDEDTNREDEDDDEDDYDYADDEDSEDWQTVEDEEEEVKVNEQIVGSADAIEALKANSGNCVVIGGHERSARSHQNAGPGSGVGTAASISTTRRMRPHPSPFAGFTSSRWMTMTTTSRKRRRRRKVGIWGWTTTTTTRKRPRRGELAAERIRYPREMIR
ncbi:hypothetical protein B296_00009711 [Ensete ventricosum]|uniref:Uncharacterized protein n=1 Tax=Ensete ventricosum TaxID=4639 RepID=A0A426ZZL1_ENSVE|nr:hypothetical protein B296_00009711 [Ensete ventricosum]